MIEVFNDIGAGLGMSRHPLKYCKWTVVQNSVRASLQPGFVGRLYRDVAVGDGTGRVNDVFLVHVIDVTKFLV